MLFYRGVIVCRGYGAIALKAWYSLSLYISMRLRYEFIILALFIGVGWFLPSWHKFAMTPVEPTTSTATTNTNLRASAQTRGKTILVANASEAKKEPIHTAHGCFATAEISVFMYHYTKHSQPTDSKVDQNLSITPEALTAQLSVVRALANSGQIAVARVSDLARFKAEKCFPAERVFAFSADDGQENNYAYLVPAAQEYQIPFTLGIITSKIDAPGFMSHQEISRALKTGYIDIASHSVNHMDQNKLSESAERKEVCDSKNTLESLFGVTVGTFIYPAGKTSSHSAALLRECGYTLGFTTKQ